MIVSKMLISILNWSEAWACLIPLYAYIFKRPGDRYLEIIAAYILTAFCINTIADVSWIFNNCMPHYFKNNNFLYNINSMLRTLVFLFFFKSVIYNRFEKLFSAFIIVYLAFSILSFVINKNNLIYLNSFLHAAEGFILLCLCISYFIGSLKSEDVTISYNSSFFIICGLALYESVSFFVFLFYEYNTSHNRKFDSAIWYVHDCIFIVFCVMIAIAFNRAAKINYGS